MEGLQVVVAGDLIGIGVGVLSNTYRKITRLRDTNALLRLNLGPENSQTLRLGVEVDALGPRASARVDDELVRGRFVEGRPPLDPDRISAGLRLRSNRN